MIHIAIYDRNPAVGMELGQLSPQFPEEYRSAVQQISESFGSPDGDAAAPSDALRYAPLADKYLLSLVLRMEAGRRYNRILHYLLDRAEAEFLLQWDLCSLMAQLKELARFSIPEQLEQLGSDSWQSRLAPWKPQVPQEPLRHALLAGACLDDSTKKVRIVIPETQTISLQLINWLMSQLPPALRIRVRFHSGVAVPAEGNGCCLLLCSPEANGRFESGAYGGELADVCICSVPEGCDYQLLRKEFEYVRPLLEAPSQSRKNALALFGREGDWEKYLKLLKIPYQNPRTELQEITALCGSRQTAAQLDNLGYSPKKLESLAKNAPDWLACDLVLHKAVDKYWDKPLPKAKITLPDDSVDKGESGWTATVTTEHRWKSPPPNVIPADENDSQPKTVAPRPPRRTRRKPSKPVNLNLIGKLLLFAALVLLLVIIAKLLLGGLQLSGYPGMLLITVAAQQCLLRTIALVLCCTALGAVGTLLVLMLLRSPKNRGNRN